jgi:hypothetical protein
VKHWRPYEDDPLFTAELVLGPAELPPALRARLLAYLEELAAHRGLLHPAVAFNAIYFGYDLDYGGYPGGPLDLDLLPKLLPGAPAPPVGAMVRIPTSGAEPLFAEAVYAEGAHPDLCEDGDLPSWLSGAPEDAIGRSADRTRLVLDFDAFGRGVVASRERLARLRRRGLLDSLGHFLLPARGSADFVPYLLGTARQCLVNGPLPLILGMHADDADLEAGARSALRTLDALLSTAPGLRRWGPYAFSRRALAVRFADDGELGGSHMSTLVTGLIRPPSRNRRLRPAESVVYTAIGPRLRAAVRDVRPEGVAYAETVCHVNTAIADVARGEADERGVLPSGGHLRVDDVWQGGGVWRVSHPPGPHAGLDPLLPLGLGWLESLPPTAAGSLPTDESFPDDLTVTDSQIDWTAPLRLRHHVEGVLPLPPRLFDELEEGEIRLRLRHDGFDLELDEADQTARIERTEAGLRLAGVAWPLEFFPGILLDWWWPRGAATLNASSTLLDSPVCIDGELVEHRYDLGAITRDRAPGRADQPGRLGLPDRILHAVRRAGLLMDGGGAFLPEGMLAGAVFGAGAEATDALVPQVAALLVAGRLSRSIASQSLDSALSFPARPGEAEISVLIWRPVVVPQAKASIPVPDLERRLRGHDVRPFLRRLRAGERATEAARAEYRKVSEKFGFGADLPSGYTIVRGHRRGHG